MYSKQHRAKQRQNLMRILNNKELTDVRMIIGEEKHEFDTNRFFLASISPVFQAMLYGNMMESEPNVEIEIADINADAFGAVLKYAYCNDPVLTVNNIIPIRQICDKYQISLMSKLCDEYFNACISEQNICSLLNQAVTTKLDFYVNIIQKLLSSSKWGSKATNIVKSDGFISMNQSAMKIFLQSDALKIKEECLWEAVLKWVENQTTICDEDNRKPPANKRQKLNDGTSMNNSVNNKENTNNCQDIDVESNSKKRLRENNEYDVHKLNLLKSISPFIRFGLMDGTYFVKNVKTLNFLTMGEIANIMCYIQCNDENCGKFSIKTRAYIKISPAVILLPYSLIMSSKLSSYWNTNTYETLITDNLYGCCRTQKSLTAFIQATFKSLMYIERMEIGACTEMVKHVNGSVLQYKVDRVWKDIHAIHLSPNVIQTFIIKVKTKEIRLWKSVEEVRYALAVGCWRLYGFEQD